MKSFFARTTLLGLTLFASVAAAKPYQGQDEISFNFKAKKSVRYTAAYASLDYGSDTLILTLNPVCPRGMMCAAVLPEPETFENVKSTVNRCGVVTSVAVIDHMPVDGIRTEVTLVDNSNYSCRGQKPADLASLRVKKSWYNRLQGKKVSTTDSFQVEAEVPFQGVIRAELDSVSSEAFQGGHLFLDSGKGLLELTLNHACREGLDCDPENPTSESFTFENAETIIDHCGIIRTTASFDDRPVDGIYMNVTINNNRNNTCPTFAPLAPLDVIVERAYYSRFEAQLVQTVDTLKADDIALIKPGK